MGDVQLLPEVAAVHEKVMAALEYIRAEHPDCPVTSAECELIEDQAGRKLHRWVRFEIVALDDDGGPCESLLRDALKRFGLKGSDTEFGVDDEGREILAVAGEVDYS